MKADKVLVNAKIFSPAEAGKVIRGEALAIKDDKLISVGNREEIDAYVAEDTEIIDCKGHSVLPGLCDAHCHPSWITSMFEACQLFDIPGEENDTSRDVIERYVERVMEFSKEKERELIRGMGWNRAFFSGSCKNPEWPTRHDLDRISKDKPIVLESYCHHVLWVNSKALELAGIDKNTPDLENGEFFREEDGTPSGILREMDAINMLLNKLPGYDFTVEQYKDTFLQYQDEMNSYGITLVNDCLCTENAIKAYEELAKENKLNMRLRGVYHLADCEEPEVVKEFAKKRKDDVVGEFQIDTVKIFLEGEMVMLEPYEEDFNIAQGNPKDYGGELFFSDDSVKKAMKLCADEGFQIHIHAMGDASVKQAVDGLVYAQEETGTELRNVIAHLMLIRDEDIKRMAEHHIVANCQARWMIFESDADVNYRTMYGEKRALDVYPNKQFLDAGCIVAYGTDFPVIPPANPYHSIECAVTRSIFEECGEAYEKYKGTVLGPKDNPSRDCVSLEDAIRSNSWSGAYQIFLEDVTGSIEVGKSADLVVLDCDIESIEKSKIHKVKADKTLFKGKVVYEA